MEEIRVLESILSPGLQTFLDTHLGHKLYKVEQWITLTLCGSSAHDVGTGGWRKCCGGMLHSLPQAIRSCPTSKFARIVSKRSSCSVGTPTKLNFSASSAGNKKSGAPRATFGLSLWMWAADRPWSICDAYCAFLFYWLIFYRYIFKRASSRSAMC